MSEKFEIVPHVYWVGVKDWSRRIFDALIPLPQGTSYNAYLVMGKKATALIDTVNPGFEEDLWQKISALIDPEQHLDYVIMNHAEPDHAGAIPWLLAKVPKAKVVLTEKGRDMAARLYHIPEERMKVVRNGESLDLGGKTLTFYEVPFVHWPETMFTFLLEDKVLFPCDFFGAHTAKGFYSDGVPDIEKLTKSYFAEIMMPYRRAAQHALEQAMFSKPAMIAPSHGPIWQQPETVLTWYQKWVTGETEPKVLVAYVSMWGATERLVQAAVETLREANLSTTVYNLATLDLGSFCADLVDSRALVFGAPTVLGGLHPLASFALNLLRMLKPPLRFALFLSSYGWGGGAARQVQDALESLGLELVAFVDVPGQPRAAELQEVKKAAQKLTQKVSE